MDQVQTLKEKAKELRELKDIKTAMNDELKNVNKRIDALEAHELPKLMTEYEIENMKIEGVGTLYTQADLYVTVYADDREKLNAWLKEHDFADLVKETVHAGTLKSWCKEQLEEGGQLPPFLKAKPLTKARIRRN